VNRSSLVRWVFVGVGIAFLAAVVAGSWGDLRDAFRDEPGRFAASVVLNAVGLAVLGGSWALLQEPGSRGTHLRRYLMTQPAKHIPGGLAQPVGQVVLAAQVGPSPGVMLARFVLHAGMLVVAGLGVGTAMAASTDVWWVGVLSMAGGVAGVLALARLAGGSGPARLFSGFSERVGGGRLAVDPEDLRLAPSRLGAGLAVAGAGTVTRGLAFALLAAPTIDLPVVVLVGAYALAWTAGFVAIPFPAGLGIREAVLGALLVAGAPFTAVVAVAVVQRLSEMLGDGVAAGAALLGERAGFKSSRTATEGDPVQDHTHSNTRSPSA
jgi:glycosyltransferase 2 family protein